MMPFVLLCLLAGADKLSLHLVEIEKESAKVRVLFGVRSDSLHVQASLPDTSYYWGDDLVVSLDVDGSGGAAPGDGDRQWYLRRDADSSVVLTASKGQWMTPGIEPPMLGSKRSGDGWSVSTASDSLGWSVHLRIARSLFGKSPRIAFRTYDSAPHGWWSWPAPREGERATLVERTPDRWVAIPVK